jgi:hypothetical protein
MEKEILKERQEIYNEHLGNLNVRQETLKVNLEDSKVHQ